MRLIYDHIIIGLATDHATKKKNADAFDNVFAFDNADDAFVLILTMNLHLIMH